MRNFALVAVVGLFPGVAPGNIDVTLTCTLGLLYGTDNAGLDGAAFVMTASFDSNGSWQSLFGYPSASAVSQGLSIDGASVGFNEIFSYLPTYAIMVTTAGVYPTFDIGGSSFWFFSDMSPAPGAGDVTIGGAIELDDFDGAIFTGFENIVVEDVLGTASYSFNNAVFTAVPAPAGTALLGLGGLVATRRRR